MDLNGVSSDACTVPDCCREEGTEPEDKAFNLPVERSHLGWFGQVIRMLRGRLALKVFWVCPTGRKPGVEPQLSGGIIDLIWPKNAL